MQRLLLRSACGKKLHPILHHRLQRFQQRKNKVDRRARNPLPPLHPPQPQLKIPKVMVIQFQAPPPAHPSQPQPQQTVQNADQPGRQATVIRRHWMLCDIGLRSCVIPSRCFDKSWMAPCHQAARFNTEHAGLGIHAQLHRIVSQDKISLIGCKAFSFLIQWTSIFPIVFLLWLIS